MTVSNYIFSPLVHAVRIFTLPLQELNILVRPSDYHNIAFGLPSSSESRMGISTLHLYHPFLLPILTPSRRPPRKLRKITNHHLLPPALRRLNNPRPILKIQ